MESLIENMCLISDEISYILFLIAVAFLVILFGNFFYATKR